MKSGNLTHTFDIKKIRREFPILGREVNGRPLVYLDNAATSQKPQPVIDAIVDYYSRYNANIHRAVHSLAQEATDAFETARRKIQTHFNALFPEEIIFTSGTTHGINLVANGFASLLEAGDEVLISTMEHHSNIVPLQMLCEKTGARLRVIPITSDDALDMDAYRDMLSERTRLVFVNHISNALGTINPVQEIVALAHAVNAAVLVDGAQACAHMKPDLRELDADFYAAGAHKMFGPTGIGFLYGKRSWLEKLPPYQGGGEMIAEVTFEKTTYADLPHKFEAGTPNIAGAVGFGAAIDYLNSIGLDQIAAYESELLDYATEKMEQIPGLKIYGTSPSKASVISFNVGSIHPYDLGTLLNKMGVAVRTGHHCAQPLMEHYHIPGTVRASFAFYNTFEEVDSLVAGIEKAAAMLA